MMIQRISEAIAQSILLKQRILDNPQVLSDIEQVVNTCVIALKSDKQLLFCGNGGSMADAAHLAAELSGRFYLDRKPLRAEALGMNPSFSSAVSNDYSYETVFEREIGAKGKEGDILIAMSTSGKSENILAALRKAKRMMMVTVGLTGSNIVQFLPFCDYVFSVPSVDTPRIQEAHMLLGHIICEQVEAQLFS